MLDIIRKKYKLFAVFLLLLVIFDQDLFYKVNAQSYSSKIVMEVNSGRILYQDNAYEKKFMASTTKILTALVIIENCNINDIVTVTKETIGIEGSSIYLEENEKLTVKDLLYGLMLRSGNDCAETLAKYCSGSINKFAELMNEKAKSLGAVNSHFTNPHGLHDDKHYTTAYDLALISCNAMKNDIFREIVSTKSVRIPFTTRETVRLLLNKNKMLTSFDGANGIKTGYTKKAGRCLVSSATRNGLEIVCVVLNCPPMFEESKTLLDNAFNTYSNKKIIESDNIIGFVKSKGKNYAVHIKNDVLLPLTEDEYKQIKIIYDYPMETSIELKSDTEIGFVEIYVANNLLFKEKIYTI